MYTCICAPANTYQMPVNVCYFASDWLGAPARSCAHLAPKSVATLTRACYPKLGSPFW